MIPSLDEVKSRRKILDLTQTQLAKLSGVSQSLIAKIEGGGKQRNPSYNAFKKIFDTLEKLELERAESKKEIPAKELCNRKIIGVNKDDIISEAAETMSKYAYSQLPVFENDRPVGSISDKIILSFITKTKDTTKLSSMKVGEIMDKKPFPQMDENTPTADIANLLMKYDAVLLIKEEGKLSGIITKADLLKEIK